jgi:hypothetical protein
MLKAIASISTNIAHLNNHPFSYERSVAYGEVCNNPLIAILSLVDYHNASPKNLYENKKFRAAENIYNIYSPREILIINYQIIK